jgi:hypothetical protein
MVFTSTGRQWLGDAHILEILKDVVLSLLIVLLFPLVILLMGTPIALFVRLLLETAQRL